MKHTPLRDRRTPCAGSRLPVRRRSSARGWQGADASGLHAACCRHVGYILPEFAVTIENRLAVGTRLRECLSQLLHYPGAGRMVRDIQMEDPSTTMLDHEEAVQHAKSQSGHCEEIHGHDGVAVIAKEGNPALGGAVGTREAAEVAGDRALGDVEAELEELAVDSGGAPGGILADHLPDESPDLGVDLRSAEALWM